jgi:PAS domain S-box-containing protein
VTDTGLAIPGPLLVALGTRAPFAVVVLDAGGRCTMAAGEGMAQLGYADGGLVGRDVLEIADAEDPDMAARLRAALAGRPGRWTWTRPGGAALDAVLEPVEDDDGHVVAVVAVGVDARERLRADASERRRLEERSAVVHDLAQVQDVERRRLAADLHDDVVQVVAGVGLRLGLLARRAADDDQAAELRSLAEQLTATGDRLRWTLRGLSPATADGRGLRSALEVLVVDGFAEAPTQARLVWAVPADLEEPSIDIADVLYRIAVEALANVRRHAAAAAVTVELRREGEIWVLEVRDDGLGAGTGERPGGPGAGGRRQGHGIAAMRHRAEAVGGMLTVLRGAGGTTVRAELPGVPDHLGLGVADGSGPGAGVAPTDVRTPVVHLLESMTDAFVALDTRWRYVWVNRRAAEAFGLPAEHLIGRVIWDVFPAAVGGPFHQACELAVAERRTIEAEAWFEAWQRWFHCRVLPATHGVTVFFRDVTAERRKGSDDAAAVCGAVLKALVAHVCPGDAVAAGVQALVEQGGLAGARVRAAGRTWWAGDPRGGIVESLVVGGRTVGTAQLAWPPGDDPGPSHRRALTGLLAVRLAGWSPLVAAAGATGTVEAAAGD